MSEVEVIERKDVGNAEDILGEIIEQVTVESEISPSDEVEQEAEEEMEKTSWAPLENDKIAGHLNILAKNLSKISKLDLYRNPGKTHYFCWRVAPRRGVVFAYLASKSARIGIGEDYFKVKEDGFFQKEERVPVKAIVSEARRFIKDKGW